MSDAAEKVNNVVELVVPTGDAAKLSDAQGKKIVGIAGAVAAVGVLLCLVAAMVDLRRFSFSYLVGFMYVATIGLGGLFFVLLQHVTKAGWSVTSRRHAEWIGSSLPIIALLFIPVALLARYTHAAWWNHDPNDHLLHAKSAWLNPTAFYIRAVVYLAIWSALITWFARRSRQQDQSGDPQLTVKMQNLSAPMILVFALSLTFAGFDWVMSMQPKWYSTIFGVYIFSGAVTSSFSVIALIMVALQKTRLLKRLSTVEHRHLIGKFVFAFVVFFAYIGFSQFVLIWYANIPEETVFYYNRWIGSWKTWSLILVFAHFVIPFIFLLSRHVKRSIPGLTIGAIIMLVAHYVDMYWLIMPILDEQGFSLSWIDAAGLLGPVGVLALVIALKAAKGPLYPLKDPRLAESMRSENPV